MCEIWNFVFCFDFVGVVEGEIDIVFIVKLVVLVFFGERV